MHFHFSNRIFLVSSLSISEIYLWLCLPVFFLRYLFKEMDMFKNKGGIFRGEVHMQNVIVCDVKFLWTHPPTTENIMVKKSISTLLCALATLASSMSNRPIVFLLVYIFDACAMTGVAGRSFEFTGNQNIIFTNLIRAEVMPDSCCAPGCTITNRRIPDLL